MSIVTWAEEFCPDFDVYSMTELDCVRHCLRKWRGFLTTHLSSHGYENEWRCSWDFSKYYSAETCALCRKHGNGDHVEYIDCDECVLCNILGDPCYSITDAKQEELHFITSPYLDWLDLKNPAPMIALLEMAEKRLLEEDPNENL